MADQNLNTTTDISSAAYFEKTFGVDAAQAANLSSQAKFVGTNRGGGITAEAPVGAPASPSPLSALTAGDEYAQLQADRAEGKVSTDAYRKRERELAEVIANGGAAQPAPAAPAPMADTLAEFAPASSPSEFVFPEPPGGHTDETMAYDATVKAAFHAEGMSPKLMNLASQMLQQDLPRQEGKTFEQLVDTQTTGLERMWKGDADSNMSVWRGIITGWKQSGNPLIRQYASAAVRLNPIVVDQIVAVTKQRASAR